MIESVIFGTLLGIVAGFTPGLHSNTFAALLLAFFSDTLPSKEIAIIIMSSAIAYTIADILPTTLLGVPDEETAIAAFPAHIMVLEGRGFEAISISVFASVVSVFISLPLFLQLLLQGKIMGS